MKNLARHIYLTGMSGTGKTSVVDGLRKKGLIAIDTDYDDWKVFSDARGEWILDEQKIMRLLNASKDIPLVVSGCCSNQSNLFKYFDCVVLLSASIETILSRVVNRQSNPYGQTPEERNEIIWNCENIQPLLKKSATIEYNTDELSVEEITDELSNLSNRVH